MEIGSEHILGKSYKIQRILNDKYMNWKLYNTQNIKILRYYFLKRFSFRNTTSVPSSNTSIPGDRRSQISRISFTEIQSNYQPGNIVSFFTKKQKNKK